MQFRCFPCANFLSTKFSELKGRRSLAFNIWFRFSLFLDLLQGRRRTKYQFCCPTRPSRPTPTTFSQYVFQFTKVNDGNEIRGGNQSRNGIPKRNTMTPKHPGKVTIVSSLLLSSCVSSSPARVKNTMDTPMIKPNGQFFPRTLPKGKIQMAGPGSRLGAVDASGCCATNSSRSGRVSSR